VQRDVGAARRLVDHLDGVVALAAGFPAHCLAGFDAGTARNHRHLVGDDEGGVETDAELADQVRVLGLVAGQRRKEFAGAGLGDGAEVLNGFVACEADAVVGNGDRARFLVEGDADLQVAVVAVERAVVQRLETQLVAGVGRVGNSSRRKISLLLYKEWIIRCSSCFTSAWKPRVSRVCAAVADSDMPKTPIQRQKVEWEMGTPVRISSHSMES
jgi:hypothetical protein